MFIATLIAAERLTRGDISTAADALRAAGIEPLGQEWVEEGSACDLRLGDIAGVSAALEGALAGVDAVVQPEAGRRKRLLAADMDSTMIGVECIDELADYAGRKAEIAAVTERAMLGELDFEAALEARVKLLAGLDEAAIERCREERVKLTPGAGTLVATMRAHGAWTLLVSGGFTAFAEPVAARLGFDEVAANRLDISDGRLGGTVARPIVGAEAKKTTMLASARSRGVAVEAVLAVGDGANDIAMIESAGLGIAYRAKPPLAAAADARIDANDLTALLYMQGYPRREWRED